MIIPGELHFVISVRAGNAPISEKSTLSAVQFVDPSRIENRLACNLTRVCPILSGWVVSLTGLCLNTRFHRLLSVFKFVNHTSLACDTMSQL